MNEQEFLKKMQEDILDTDEEITMDTVLEDIEEWDSLAFVSFIAMAKVMNRNDIDRKAVRGAEKVGELYELICQ